VIAPWPFFLSLFILLSLPRQTGTAKKSRFTTCSGRLRNKDTPLQDRESLLLERLAQGYIINIDVALGIPAVDVDDDACLASAGGEGERKFGVTRTRGPGRDTASYTQVGVGTIDIGAQDIGVISLNGNGLGTLTSGGAAWRELGRTSATMHW
jgi:hypothetical protein